MRFRNTTFMCMCKYIYIYSLYIYIQFIIIYIQFIYIYSLYIYIYRYIVYILVYTYIYRERERLTMRAYEYDAHMNTQMCVEKKKNKRGEGCVSSTCNTT